MNIDLLAAACVVLCLSLPALAQQQPKAPSTLEDRVRLIASQHHGGVALYAENLATHQTLGIDPDRPVQTASVIKLAILFDAMEQVRADRLTLAQPIQLTAADQVGGSGILQLFHTSATFTLHDILMLMITQSDNTATNLAIDTLGLDAIDKEIQQLGLTQTWLYKKVSKPPTGPMPADQKKFGLGKTTPREMAAILERIYHCSFVNPANHTATTDQALCTDMLTLLQKQFYRDAIPRYLERDDTSEQADAAIGNKTGSLDAVRNDVALIATKSGPVILSVFTYNNTDQGWYSDNEAEITIAKLARDIIDAWSPTGLSPEAYKVSPQPQPK